MLALLIALAAAQPAATGPAARPAVHDLVSPVALMLESIVNPDDELFALRRRAFVDGFWKGLDDPDSARLEREHPGLWKAVGQVLVRLFEKELRARLPNEHREMARFLEARFETAELSQLIHHFASAKGASTIAALAATSAANDAASPGFMRSATYAKFLAALPDLRRMQNQVTIVPGSAAERKMEQALGAALRAFLAAERAAPTR